MGGVRLFGSLVCTAADAAGLVAATRAAHGLARRAPRWDLAYEVHYPTAEHNMVPFVRVHAAPELLIGMHQALGPDEYAPGRASVGATAETLPSDDSSPSAPSADSLILLHCKNGLLLLSQRSLQRGRLPTAEVSSATGLASSPVAPSRQHKRPCLEMERDSLDSVAAAGDAAAALGAGPAMSAGDDDADVVACQSLPWWLAAWTVRGFSFSSACDPIIATAALNLAACTHLARTDLPPSARPPSLHESTTAADGTCKRGLACGPLGGLRVYDPCCGSGTILMAALANGAAAVAGSDMRAEFVEGATSNLQAMGVLDSASTPLFCHDASVDLPDGKLPPRVEAAGSGESGGSSGAPPVLPWCDVIVCNPPWGKNCGKPEDGSPIALSMCRQFRHVTMVLLINKFTRAVLEAQPPEVCTVHRVTKLGGVEAVLLTT